MHRFVLTIFAAVCVLPLAGVAPAAAPAPAQERDDDLPRVVPVPRPDAAPSTPLPAPLPGMPAPGAEEDISGEDLLDALLERLAETSNKDQAAVLEDAVLRLWLRSGSDTVDLLMNRALIAMKDENLARSLDLLNAVIDLKPDYAEGWNKRATVFFHMGDYGRSLNDVERTLALEPRHFGALAGLGLIMRELGDNERALTAFRRALAIHPFLSAAQDAEEELSDEVEGRGI